MFSRQANQIRLSHNTESDLKLLNDPILDYDIVLTPKLLRFGNVASVVDMYLKKSGIIDENKDDLGLKQRLVG